MLMNRNSVYPLLSTLCAAVLCGCPTPEPSDPGATEPGPLTTATGVPAETTDAETFTPPTTSTTEAEDPTETSSSTTGETTSTTASLDPLWCDAVLEGDEGCRMRARTFCEEVAFDADVLPEPYRQIAIDKCETAPCDACFYLANTCVQLLGEKGCGEDLYERCVCLADLHGVI